MSKIKLLLSKSSFFTPIYDMFIKKLHDLILVMMVLFWSFHYLFFFWLTSVITKEEIEVFFHIFSSKVGLGSSSVFVLQLPPLFPLFCFTKFLNSCTALKMFVSTFFATLITLSISKFLLCEPFLAKNLLKSLSFLF